MVDLITPVLTYLTLDNAALIGIGAGCLGGSVKATYSTWINYCRGESTVLWKFGLTLLISLVIGGAIGYLFNFDYRVSGLAGFAGLDILSNIGKASISSTKFTMNKNK